jgi:hypothetical protein
MACRKSQTAVSSPLFYGNSCQRMTFLFFRVPNCQRASTTATLHQRTQQQIEQKEQKQQNPTTITTTITITSTTTATTTTAAANYYSFTLRVLLR